MIGPNAGVAAVPAGAVLATRQKTPHDRPLVNQPGDNAHAVGLRVPFIDSFQGPILAAFAAEEFGAERACVLYAADSDELRGAVDNSARPGELTHGAGSVPPMSPS